MRCVTLPVVFGLDELACAVATQAAMPHVAPRLDGRAFAGQQPMVGSTPRIGFDSLIVQWLNGLGLGACTRNGVGEDNVAKHCLHHPEIFISNMLAGISSQSRVGPSCLGWILLTTSRTMIFRNARLLLASSKLKGLASLVLRKLRWVDKVPGACHRHHRASRVVFVRNRPTADRCFCAFVGMHKALIASDRS